MKINVKGNIENLQKLENTVSTFNCPNGYTKGTIENNFFETESESRICESCDNFCYRDGFASCSLMSQ